MGIRADEKRVRTYSRMAERGSRYLLHIADGIQSSGNKEEMIMFKALQALAVVALVSTTATGAFAQSRGGPDRRFPWQHRL